MNPNQMTKQELHDLANLRHILSMLLTAQSSIATLSCDKSPGTAEAMKEAKQNIDKAVLSVRHEIENYR